jgi:hypothetical protein
MLKCHFIIMASNELTSVREAIISAEELPWSYYLLWSKLDESLEIPASNCNKFVSECEILKAEVNK